MGSKELNLSRTSIAFLARSRLQSLADRPKRASAANADPLQIKDGPATAALNPRRQRRSNGGLPLLDLGTEPRASWLQPGRSLSFYGRAREFLSESRHSS